MHLLGLALGLVTGLSLGLLGGGGSILTVPIFVYLLGYGVKPSVAMSLAVVGATSALGTLSHAREGNVNLRAALAFGVVAMGGSFLGTRVAALVSERTQLMLFGLIMLAAAGFMLRPAGNRLEAEVAAPTHWILVALIGGAVGVLTGLIGVGGGFLIVPALVLLGRLPMKQAVGTSLLVITLNSVTGFAGYLGRVSVDWVGMAEFTAPALIGVLAGTRFGRGVPHGRLRQAFGCLLIVVGVLMLFGPAR